VLEKKEYLNANILGRFYKNMIMNKLKIED
jgi:hypothetical protein